MSGKVQYQHFIPKFILRKYDAEYREPDQAHYKAEDYNDDPKRARKRWDQDKKDRQH